ncbi:hypothetical protein [Altererythrobacter ishigakiensis]|uniref:Uncharacterized protein n=1 Tax=Altererythrobacter ishigakiensis TaxID=476157 RepID=A0A562UN81_9SPHN|nr:hypothetical protein [Altererythrobacter ishigakiensis]TWJ07058.1 hypothetical protein JN10_2606 [Altererythrobacter ishigakiensis]
MLTAALHNYPMEHDQAPLLNTGDWIDRLADSAPRLSVLALIAMAWSLTLAWPPTVSDGPLVEGGTQSIPAGSYPLRVDLPNSGSTVSVEKLIALSEIHPAIAALGLVPEPVNEATTEASALTAAPARSVGEVAQGSSRNFADAFADFTASLPASQRSDARAAAALAAAEGLEPGAFLNLDYDLATLAPSQPASGGSGGPASYNASDGSLTVTKPLMVDGESKGRATIRIEEGAQIFIATSAVADALGPRAQALPSRVANAIETGTGFIPFHELRGAGVAVEYDPVTDRVSLSMPAGA